MNNYNYLQSFGDRTNKDNNPTKNWNNGDTSGEMLPLPPEIQPESNMRTAKVVIESDLEYSEGYWKYKVECKVREDGLVENFTIISAKGLDSTALLLELTPEAEEMIQLSVVDKVIDMLADGKVNFDKLDEENE